MGLNFLKPNSKIPLLNELWALALFITSEFLNSKIKIIDPLLLFVLSLPSFNLNLNLLAVFFFIVHPIYSFAQLISSD